MNRDVDGGEYGQNIAAGVKADNVSAVITELFYNGEVSFYDNLYGQEDPSMDNFHEWGHFSQIVWKGTTEVGCATVDCSSQSLANTGGNVPPYFTVCNYKSQGMLKSHVHRNRTTLIPSQATWEASTPTTSRSPVATPPATGTTACRHKSTQHPICGLLRLSMRARLATNQSSRKLTTAMHLLFLLPTSFFQSRKPRARSLALGSMGPTPSPDLSMGTGLFTSGTESHPAFLV